MVDKEWMEGYDPVVTGEQDEWGNDLDGLRYNLSLTPEERWIQYVGFAKNVGALVDAARSSGLTQAGRGLGL